MRKTIAARLKPVIAAALMTGLGLVAAACGSAASPASPAAHTVTPRQASAATTAPPAPLACGVHASRHPVAGTLTGVRVRTAPHARIAATAHYASRVQKQGARANALGKHTFSYPAGRGRRIVVGIRASLHSRKGACETSFKARQPAPPLMPAPPMPAPTMAAPTPTPTMM